MTAPQKTEKLKMLIWVGTGVVVAMISASQALTLYGFNESRRQGQELRALLCDVPSVKQSQYCHEVQRLVQEKKL